MWLRVSSLLLMPFVGLSAEKNAEYPSSQAVFISPYTNSRVMAPAMVTNPPGLSMIGRKLQAIRSAVVTKDQGGPPLAPKVQSRSVTLAWDPSPATNVLWYHLYWGGASRSYTNHIETQTTSATVSNLDNGGTYYFAATVAVKLPSNDWLESDYSAEVSYTEPWQPVGISVVSAQPEVTFDGVNWSGYGPAYYWTNPGSPMMLFRVRPAVTNY